MRSPASVRRPADGTCCCLPRRSSRSLRCFSTLRAKPAALDLPAWAATLPIWPIAASLLLGPLLLAVARKETVVQMRALSFAVLGAMGVLVAGVMSAIAPYGDPAPAAAHLAELEKRNVPLAHLGKYHAQYNFVGRLRKPIAILDQPELARVGRCASRRAGHRSRAQPVRGRRFAAAIRGAVPRRVDPGVARRGARAPQMKRFTSASRAIGSTVAAPTNSFTSGMKSSFRNPNRSTVIWQPIRLTPPSMHAARSSSTLATPLF